MSEPRWLLLAHQLPARLSNARVKTWRRLQQLGAVPSRNSVYVLPNTEQCREDFEWLRAEIVALGGEATVFAADAISQGGGEDIVSVFQAGRARDYRALQKEIRRLLPTVRAKRTAGAGRQKAARAVHAVRDRFEALERIDFFGAAARDETAAALAGLEQTLAGPASSRAPLPSSSRKAQFQGRRWVTRRRPGVDRMASAWLIRRFVDPAAIFAFVDTPAESDVPFDMYAGGFGHRGGLCTFEVLCQEFGIASAAVTRIAQIVHDLDLKEHKYDAPEAPVVGRMIDGMRAVHADDPMLLEQGIGMFEALARSLETT
ncbi:MAG TPA: chromate resistance protein ChrB domain-containing protein [Vicinamibacterales bacterium]|nr:chromate resistance protein ChrB domain-containing protein [Vicinamibacterales bacterium]